MSLFTNISTALWQWEPFRRLERDADDVVGRTAKLLWLALYTAPESKAYVPGIFCGSATTLAESASMPVDVVRSCLDRLIEDDLIEMDIQRRIIRMTVLPDCGESPANGRAIRGWWRRFQNVPECTIRDNHVSVLRWILDEWCRRNGKALSNDHAVAWTETFGRLPAPSPRRRIPKHVQTDLFTANSGSGSAKQEIKDLDTNKGSTLVELDPDPEPDQDPGSQIRKSTRDAELAEGTLPGTLTRAELSIPAVARTSTGVSLRLVPSGAYDADAFAETMAEATSGKFPRALTRAQWNGLQRVLESTGLAGGDPAVVDVLRDYVKHGMPGFDRVPLDSLSAEERAMRSRGISPELVASPGWLTTAIQRASEWAAKANEQIAMAEEARRILGYSTDN